MARLRLGPRLLAPARAPAWAPELAPSEEAPMGPPAAARAAPASGLVPPRGPFRFGSSTRKEWQDTEGTTAEQRALNIVSLAYAGAPVRGLRDAPKRIP